MDGRIERPKTISELQQYCEEHGMPLLRMRFFIGEDYRQPKAFGIYQEGDTFVVYKNKDTGERAIRYIGTDEAYAVGEIFDKLLSECHKRGIYPDGESAYLDAPVSRGYPQRSGDRSQKLLIGGIIGFFAVVILAVGIGSHRMHRHDGYYKDDKGTYYYRYGSDWSYYDSTSNCWTSTLSFPYEDYTDYSVEGDYDLSWGISSIETSSLWDDWHTSSSYDSGSSYDSWDSGGTDWSSDW